MINNYSSVYHDMHGLEALKHEASNFDRASIKKTAQQFESVFIQSMLKAMRNTNEVFKDKEMVSSDSMDLYEGMFDQQVSMAIAERSSLGLAKIIEEQLSKDKRFVSTETKTLPLNQTMSHARPVDHKVPVIPMKNNETSIIKDTSDITNNKNLDEPVTTPKEFVKRLYPIIKSLVKNVNIDPKMLLAQAALETGWGKFILKHQDGQSSYNLFNIKANTSWSLDKVKKASLEFVNGIFKPITSEFRSYGSFHESVKDYIQLVSNNKRYAEALGSSDPKQYIHRLHKAGYATDPNYSEKILDIYNSDIFKQLDTKN